MRSHNPASLSLFPRLWTKFKSQQVEADFDGVPLESRAEISEFASVRGGFDKVTTFIC